MKQCIYIFMLVLMQFLPTGCSDVSPDVLLQGDGKADRADAAGMMEGADCLWPFRPASVRIHPLTNVKWDADAGENVIEVYLEMLDRFGHTTKGVGRIRFELYSGVTANDLPGGVPLKTWRVNINGEEENLQHYDWVMRLYNFNLSLPGAAVMQEDQYLLQVTINMPTGELLKATRKLP